MALDTIKVLSAEGLGVYPDEPARIDISFLRQDGQWCGVSMPAREAAYLVLLLQTAFRSQSELRPHMDHAILRAESEG